MTGFLLDTNVVSEVIHPRPDARVAVWMKSTDLDLLHLSVLTIGEIHNGIVSLADPVRKSHLETWLIRDLAMNFENRILPVDQPVAERWGQLAGVLVSRGIQLALIDGLLAATALHHQLTLVTRNPRDFALTGVTLIDPWTG